MSSEDLDMMLLLEMMDDDSTMDDIFELLVLRQMMNTVEDCANIICNYSSVSQPKHGGSNLVVRRTFAGTT